MEEHCFGQKRKGTTRKKNRKKSAFFFFSSFGNSCRFFRFFWPRTAIFGSQLGPYSAPVTLSPFNTIGALINGCSRPSYIEPTTEVKLLVEILSKRAILTILIIFPPYLKLAGCLHTPQQWASRETRRGSNESVLIITPLTFGTHTEPYRSNTDHTKLAKHTDTTLHIHVLRSSPLD